MKLVKTLIALAFLPGFAGAEDYPFLAKDTKEFRLGLKLDEEAGNEGDAGVGFEIGFGQALYPLDSVSISLLHEDNDGDDLTQLIFLIEEHFPLGTPLVPYAAAGAGYGWLGIDDVADSDSIVFRFDVGAKLRLTENVAVSAALEFSWSDKELFMEEGGAEDKNIELGLGFRYYY